MDRINMETVQCLRDLGEPGEPDPLREYVDLFVSNSPECLQAIRQTFAAADIPGLVRAAHTLKGSSSNLGADQLAQLCGELEHQAKEGSIAGADALIQKIEAEYEQARQALEALCQS